MYILAFFFMFIKADIDKDNVTPNRFDTSERYDIHKFTSKEAAKPSRTRNYYRIDTAILGSKSISITQPIIQQSSSLITCLFFLVQISSYNTSFYIIILNIKYVFLKGKVHITGIIMKY